MTPATTTVVAGVIAITGIVNEALTPGQTWTLVGILGAVIAGMARGIQWFCNRLVTQLDDQSKHQSSALNRNTDAAVANTGELRRVSEVLRDLPDRIVNEIANEMRDLPERVVDEIKRREKP